MSTQTVAYMWWKHYFDFNLLSPQKKKIEKIEKKN